MLLVLFGDVAANDQAVLERASVLYVDDDQRGPDAILDIIRRAS